MHTCMRSDAHTNGSAAHAEAHAHTVMQSQESNITVKEPNIMINRSQAAPTRVDAARQTAGALCVRLLWRCVLR
eukprot:1877187-Alexandrium_andersonii.AAC.1